MTIHWLWDLGIILVGTPILLIIVSPFILSSRISRREEELERQDQDWREAA